MSDWCASQLPVIAARVLAQERDGRKPDHYRVEWAETALRNEAARMAGNARRLAERAELIPAQGEAA